MKKKILIGSIITIAIILLSSFSSAVGKVSSDNELVEFDVEFCGLGKKHSVKLTQQEATEVEFLFDEIRTNLDNVETREEAEVIFKEAIVELDKYGLLGVLSAKQVQELITDSYQNQRLKRWFEEKSECELPLSNNSNYLCFIAGKTSGTISFDSISIMGVALAILRASLYREAGDFFLETEIGQNIMENFPNFVNAIGYFLSARIFLPLIGIIFSVLFPFELMGILTFGDYSEEFYYGNRHYHPSVGWISTFGLNGIKVWRDLFYGQIATIPVIYDGFYIGAVGFTGLKFYLPDFGTEKINTLFIGSSLRVEIGTEHL